MLLLLSAVLHHQHRIEELARQVEPDHVSESNERMTYVAYYGDRDELEMVMGAPSTKAYDWCFTFATLTVVGGEREVHARHAAGHERRAGR